jgi:hypothetical protein
MGLLSPRSTASGSVKIFNKSSMHFQNRAQKNILKKCHADLFEWTPIPLKSGDFCRVTKHDGIDWVFAQNPGLVVFGWAVNPADGKSAKNTASLSEGFRP